MDAENNKIQPNAKPIEAIVFGAILLALLIVVGRLFAPFFTVLLWSALLYIMGSPLHERITRKMDFSKTAGIIKKNIIAGVFALGTVVLILVPLSFLAVQFYRQAMELVRYARDFFFANPSFLRNIIQQISDFLNELFGGQFDINTLSIQNRIMGMLSLSTQNILTFSSNLALNTGTFIAGLLFMIFTLFFFYLDGPVLARLVLNLVPIKKDYTKVIANKFKDIAKKLLMGYIVVALIQAAIAYIVFLIFRVNGALVFSVLTFLCVFIPIVGGSLIWLPLGITRILSGDVTGGIIFLIVSGIAISSIDNLIRPMLLQNRIQLHPLLIFFAIIGGLQTFGFNGLILGPMVVIIFLTVLNLFLTEHGIGQKIENES